MELASIAERFLWINPEKFSGAAALFAEQMNQQDILEPLIP
jgi:hypothetical protein